VWFHIGNADRPSCGHCSSASVSLVAAIVHPQKSANIWLITSNAGVDDIASYHHWKSRAISVYARLINTTLAVTRNHIEVVQGYVALCSIRCFDDELQLEGYCTCELETRQLPPLTLVSVHLIHQTLGRVAFLVHLQRTNMAPVHVIEEVEAGVSARNAT